MNILLRKTFMCAVLALHIQKRERCKIQYFFHNFFEKCLLTILKNAIFLYVSRKKCNRKTIVCAHGWIFRPFEYEENVHLVFNQMQRKKSTQMNLRYRIDGHRTSSDIVTSIVNCSRKELMCKSRSSPFIYFKCKFSMEDMKVVWNFHLFLKNRIQHNSVQFNSKIMSSQFKVNDCYQYNESCPFKSIWAKIMRFFNIGQYQYRMF